jgi:hypothetical protein
MRIGRTYRGSPVPVHDEWDVVIDLDLQLHVLHRK